MWYRRILLCISICLITVLVACSGGSTKEKIYDHLEKSVTLEETFVKQQEPITDLEKQEKELYSEIIDLGMDDFDKIQELSKQAIDAIDERADKVDLEKESIDSSKEEFVKIEDSIDDLKDETVIDKANEMYDVMMDRYDAYDDLYESYTNSLTLEKDLYTMLQDEDLEQEAMTEHITKINDSYQDVLDKNEAFNEYTVEYNALKKEFYDVADIDVQYDEDVPTKDKDNNDNEKADSTNNE